MKNYKLPKMYGFQAEGASPIVKGKIVENPETIATAIRIGNPASWDKANEAVNDSGGGINSVSDFEIVESYKNLARKDGIFCEPASAAGIAGLIKNSEKYNFSGQKIVCIVTGNGLKDPETSEKHASTNIFEVNSNIDDVLKVIR